MLFIIGLVIVVVSVVIGYLMHAGDMWLLWQPNELIIILGAGLGSALISSPWIVVKRSFASLSYLFKGKPYDKKDYIELLMLCFGVFRLMKTKGMLEIESHIDNPKDSTLFKQNRIIAETPEILGFMRDNIRLITVGVEDMHQLEDIINADIEVYEHDMHEPGKFFLTLGDALPALGIVAAVLGVIVTMRSILEPPEVLGGMISAALVGTFTGVLFAYGIFNPIGHFLSKYAHSQVNYLECIKCGIVAYAGGNTPTVIIEFMRKMIPIDIRPSFEEVDRMINNK